MEDALQGLCRRKDFLQQGKVSSHIFIFHNESDSTFTSVLEKNKGDLDKLATFD